MNHAKNCDVSIVIGVPVRNEVERLPALLHALAAQKSSPPFAVALFFDSCDDGSEAIVDAMAQGLPFTVVTECCSDGEPANAGRARGRALALAETTTSAGIFMTTDADSEPAPDWVRANLCGLDAADIVAGRIVPEARLRSSIQTRLEAYFDRLHVLRRLFDPVPWEAPSTHHWTSGASLAVHRQVYHAVGGFPADISGEDAKFADLAARGGYRLRRDATVKVMTSTRRTGRVSAGMAASLSLWDRAEEPPKVAHPDDEAWRFMRQQDARRVHGSGSLAGLAHRLGLPVSEVDQVASECSNGEAFAARIVGTPPGGMRHLPLYRAEQVLTKLETARVEEAA